MTCQTCGGTLTGRQKMFCCASCRNVPNGKKMGGWNRARVSVTCENCNIAFEVVPSRKATVRACSRRCLAALQSRERAGVFGVGAANPMYKDGRAPLSYRRNLKAACERCGSDRNLLIHHTNENRQDNRPENLETLCKRCHQLHHECWNNLPNGRKDAA